MSAVDTAARVLPPLQLDGLHLWQQLPAELVDVGDQAVTGELDVPAFARRSVELLADALRGGDAWEPAVVRPVWDRVLVALSWVRPVPHDHTRDVIARLQAGEIDPSEARALLDNPPPVEPNPGEPTAWRVRGRNSTAAFAERSIAWLCWRVRHDGYRVSDAVEHAERMWPVVADGLAVLVPERVAAGFEQRDRKDAWYRYDADRSPAGWPPRR